MSSRSGFRNNTKKIAITLSSITLLLVVLVLVVLRLTVVL